MVILGRFFYLFKILFVFFLFLNKIPLTKEARIITIISRQAEKAILIHCFSFSSRSYFISTSNAITRSRSFENETKKTRMNVYKEKLLSISFSNSQIYYLKKKYIGIFPSTHALTFVSEEGSPFMKRTISILVRVTSGKYYFFCEEFSHSFIDIFALFVQ